MIEVVKCSCGGYEYEGKMIWYNGKQYCRACTYERWQKESDWKPSKDDLTYPG